MKYSEFLIGVDKHTMQILRNDGVYRHLSFSNDGSCHLRYDIITWPGHLAITGDVGSLTFARLEDMFQFFRSSNRTINPSYWGEKVVAGLPIDEFAADIFRKTAINEASEWEFETEDIRDEVLGDVYTETQQVEQEHEAYDFGYTYVSDYGHAFSDAWEWVVRKYTTKYLWKLWAIVHGIILFDREVGST